jgi:hypothetical protein
MGATSILRCIECGVESDGLTTGGRAFLVAGDEKANEILMFCPR